MPALPDPVRIGARASRNRLYRAPVLEVAPQGPGAARILARELAPSAAAGCGLVFQGACLVTPRGGRSAPGLLRVHDKDFVASLRPAVEEVQSHGALLVMQLGFGGLQCMELWHAEYRATHPGLETLCVSEPPAWFRAVGKTPILDLSTVRVMTEQELGELAEAFGRSAGYAAEAGYDGVHLAGANASIFQQCWSPVFNKRNDIFGEDKGSFFRLVVEAIRRHTPQGFLLTTKIPCESAAPFFVRGALAREDTVRIARAAADLGVDAIVPVNVGVTRDQATARGRYPGIAWEDPRWQAGYNAAFGRHVGMMKLANRAQARLLPATPHWNAELCKAVKRAVDVPVLCEGGVRSRAEMDALLQDGTCDMVGMARPFYAEPRLAWRLLHERNAEALCESCNNCTIPQVTGATGVCRTPAILAKRGELARLGAYGPE
ncbi:MAG TPA: NADH:flavin oxidoreductase [Candidatus Thermoplasmatota archaeon]|nr:NADH:flavin oxidoreductase [Candidatus Thermoplasmatota archaeon]